MVLDFSRDMQDEVVSPPASGVGFDAEYTRLATEALFGDRTPSEAADAILEVLAGMQPEA